jgi:hypothetical protein
VHTPTPLRRGVIVRVQTFLSKVSVEALHQMDEHINAWLEEHNVEPKHITQTFSHDTNRQPDRQESVVITSVWY